MPKSPIDQLRERLGGSRRSGARRSRSSSLLLVALGATAGIALGVVIADRAGGVSGLLRKAGARRRRPLNSGTPIESLSGWRTGSRRSDSFDEMEDDDSELSPESIAHMHVRHDDATRDSMRAHARGTDRGPASDTTAGVHELPVHHEPDEAELEGRVLEAFINDPILSERAIDICASGSGVIELTGWVHASGEIGHALTLARGVPDVRTVVDRLAVRGATPSRDHSGFRYAGPPPGGDGSRLD